MGGDTEVHVYVLRSLKDGKHYVGLSKDVARRLVQHNGGQVPSTKGRRPFELKYVAEAATLSEARTKEKYLKSAAGRKHLARLGV